MHRFAASLHPRLKALTLAAAAGTCVAAGWLALHGAALAAAALVAALLALAGASVRGYAVDGRRLWIVRHAWKTPIDLSELSGAAPEPRLLGGSVSLFTTRGVFGVNGYAWRRGTGAYRAWLTDPSRAVVLRFRRGPAVAVSPRDTGAFLAALGPVPGAVPPLPGLRARPPPVPRSSRTHMETAGAPVGAPPALETKQTIPEPRGGGAHVHPGNSRESGPPGLHSRALRRAAAAHLRHRVRR